MDMSRVKVFADPTPPKVSKPEVKRTEKPLDTAKVEEPNKVPLFRCADKSVEKEMAWRRKHVDNTN